MAIFSALEYVLHGSKEQEKGTLNYYLPVTTFKRYYIPEIIGGNVNTESYESL